MLIEFTCKNYKCFEEETILSMVADNELEEQTDSLFRIPGYEQELLPVASIYGANGSGKTTLLQAFNCLRELATTLAAAHHVEGEPGFRVLFRIGEHWYQYLVSVKDREIYEESLSKHDKDDNMELLFERTGNSVELGETLEWVGIEATPKTSYLATLLDASDFYPDIRSDWLTEVRDWFCSWKSLDYTPIGDPLFGDDYTHSLYPELTEKDKEQTIILLNAFDIDVEDFRCVDEDGCVLKLCHKGDRWVDLENEPSGVRKLINIAPQLLKVIKKGGIAFSDGLEEKLHPCIVEWIIELFLDKDLNKNNAQLIFTSHQVWNMSNVRADEVWFVDKGDGSSVLYSLVDFEGEKYRTPENYLYGRFGAIPYTRSFFLD